MDTLFDVEADQKEPEKKTEIKCAVSSMPTRCKKCGATYQEPSCHVYKCMLCESQTEAMQWHDYVSSLKNYMHKKCSSKIDKFADEIKAEFDKSVKYAELMGLDSADILDAHNLSARSLVVDFEEKMWDQ